MNALVLVAGHGTRLSPLTDNCPKALLPVGDKLMLEWTLNWLIDGGVSGIVLNPQTKFIGKFIETCEPYLDLISVLYYPEAEPLGSYVTLVDTSELLGEKFIVVNGDTLFGDSLGYFLSKVQHSDPITIMTCASNNPCEGGVVVTCNEYVAEFVEKPIIPPGNSVYAGLSIFSRSCKKLPCTDIGNYLSKTREKIHTVRASRYVLDIGTPVNYAASQQWRV